MELHGTSETDAGAAVDRNIIPEAEGAANPLTQQA
jgi:hypothetical protein